MDPSELDEYNLFIPSKTDTLNLSHAIHVIICFIYNHVSCQLDQFVFYNIGDSVYM